MSHASVAKRRKPTRLPFVHKPRGVLQPRVENVGPQRFGIVAIDCAKARSVWMLCDFYGKVLLPASSLTHSQWDFDAALNTLRRAVAEHHLQDIIVAIERTGNYHQPVKRAFAAAGYECRIVHPFATKQFRQAANPGNKTDDIDTVAIFRAAVNGFGLSEQPLDPTVRQLRMLVRLRRDLIRKRSALCCQIREHLDAMMPGYAACFADPWDNPVAMHVARHCGSPTAVQTLGIEGLRSGLAAAGHRFQQHTVERLVVWANNAATPAVEAPVHRRIVVTLEDDRQAKSREIAALEPEIAALLVQTPYVLLLSVPGIHVVSAAELAAELGPIEHYASARAITGRAGLFPARYQSDAVDRPRGKLIRCANRCLRAALLMVADNLLKCNPHFRALGATWKTLGKDGVAARVKVASRFCRIAYQVVAGRQVFHHPCLRQRSYILDKLLAFHCDHQTAPATLLADVQAAIAQVPTSEYAVEAEPLVKQLLETQSARRRGPKLLGEILPIVLAKLGVGDLQSNASGEQDPG